MDALGVEKRYKPQDILRRPRMPQVSTREIEPHPLWVQAVLAGAIGVLVLAAAPRATVDDEGGVREQKSRWRFIATREMMVFGGPPDLSTPAAVQPVTDEQQLRDIQRRLADAWLQRDRAAIETILAPEWSVTQPDGQILSRATVLGPFFDGLRLDTFVVDDVSVMLFGTTAVVRGRTVASGTLHGSQVSARIRFSDVFIKRDGQWQAVASHASPLIQ
jgi:hypothetical protein